MPLTDDATTTLEPTCIFELEIGKRRRLSSFALEIPLSKIWDFEGYIWRYAKSQDWLQDRVRYDSDYYPIRKCRKINYSECWQR